MHGVKRHECYELMIGSVSEVLAGKLKKLGEANTAEAKAQLDSQLDKCFKMYRIPHIRPIVLETMNQIPDLSDSYVEKIVADPALYSDASVRVKRQVWMRHEDLFVDAVGPVIEDYVRAKRSVLCSIDPCQTNFFSSETTKSRRQWDHIQLLVSMFGEYEKLYLKMMSMIRESFLSSGDSIYCSLKQEIIMAAHECGVEVVIKKDPAHELAWCLDTCLRDKHIDAAQTTRLKNILEAAKKYTPEVVGELAMISADAHVVHFLSTMALKLLRDAGGHVPREQGGLQLIVRLLALACSAHRIVQTDSVPPQMVEMIFFTKFLPAMAALVVEDQMRVELAKNDKLEEAESMGLYSSPPDLISTFLKSDPAAALLWIHYTVDLLPRRNLDVKGMLRYLRLMPILKDQMSCRGPWSHVLTHRLLASPLVETLVNDSEVVGILIDRLFLSSLKVDVYMKYQLLRIVHQLHRILHPSISAAIMEHISLQSIGDCTDTDRYSSDYGRALNKIAPKEEEPPPTPQPGRVFQVPQNMVAATPARIVAATPSHAFDQY